MHPGIYKTAVAVPSYRGYLELNPAARLLASDKAMLAFCIVTWLAAKALLLALADIQLHYDEAQYWEWSQRLDWSYYSKGPLVAWLIALAEFIFGKGEWQVRLFGWLAHGGLLWTMFHFTFALSKDRRAAWWALAITALTPEYFALGAIMTTDTLLLCCWSWALWASHRALYGNDSRAWYQVGAAVGLGMLAKLTMLLLPAAVFIWMFLDRSLRARLRCPQLWAGVALALLLVSPLLWWNLQHDWVMFRHEQHRFAPFSLSPELMLTFVAGQLMALSPLVAVLAVPLVYRRPSPPASALVWGISGMLTLFFFLRNLTGEVEVNWPAPIYLGWIALFAGALRAQTPRFRRWLAGGLALSLLLLAAVFFPALFSLPVDSVASLRNVSGWRQQIEQLYRQAPAADFLLTVNYPLAAELAFYWPENLPVYVVGSEDRRFNQHDLWPGVEREAGRNALVLQTSPVPVSSLVRAFTSCRNVSAAAPARMRHQHSLQVLYCHNYVPVSWPTPGHY